MNPKIVSSIIYFFTEHFSRIISPISIVLISQLFKTSLWGWNSLGFSKISVFEEHLSIRVFSWIAEKMFHVYLLFLTGKMQDKCWVKKLWKTRNHYIFERPMFRLLWLFFHLKSGVVFSETAWNHNPPHLEAALSQLKADALYLTR